MKATFVNPSLPNLHAAAPGSGKPQETPGAGFARQLSAHAATHVPPAQAARAALAARPDLSDRPFGAIVSLLARHQELPAGVEPEPAPAEPPAGDEVETVEPPIAGPIGDETAGSVEEETASA